MSYLIPLKTMWSWLKASSVFLLFVVIVSSLSSLLLTILPGDPTHLLVGEYAQEHEYEALRESLGLNLPAHERLLSFWTRLFSGDLGTSYFYQKDCMELIASHLPPTLYLCFWGLLLWFAFVLIFLAALAASSGKSKYLNGFLFFFQSTPIFLLAPVVLALAALSWSLYPASESATSLILPAAIWALVQAAWSAKLLWRRMEEQSGLPYALNFQLQGWGGLQLYFLKIFPSALPLLVDQFINCFAALVGGSLVLESYFEVRGLGMLLFESFSNRDFPLFQALLFWSSFSYFLVFSFGNLLKGAFVRRWQD